MIQEISRSAHRTRGGKVVLVTSTWQKNHQPAPMDADDRILMQALHERGCAVRSVSWNDPHLSWQPLVEAGSVIVVRALPTQAHEREALLTWAEEVATQTLVRATPRVLRWNTQKRFLLDLVRHGVPILPCLWVRGLDEQWSVMDVELVKPRLHLEWSEKATARLADALVHDAREQSRLSAQQQRRERWRS